MKTCFRITGVAAAAALTSGLLIAAPASAAPAAPEDLGTYTGLGSTEDLTSVDMGTYLLYQGETGANGAELFRTSGTAGSTSAVEDINPGAAGSAPRYLVKAGSSAFFAATSAAGGRELWKSNGTADGTVQVEDLVGGATGSSPTDLVALGNKVLFSAKVQSNGGEELWISDGTAAGTTLVKDIDPAGDSSPSGLVNVDGTVYFSASDGTHGNELWKTDGTPGGTVMVEDIVNGSGSSNPGELAAFGDRLMFAASTGLGNEIWTSQGSAGSTSILRDIYPGNPSGAPQDFTPVGGVAFFNAKTGGEGYELWKTDGTTLGTVMVKDIYPGTGSSSPGDLVALGSKLIFNADDTSDDAELWSSDGTTAGTTRLKDIRPGRNVGGNPQDMVVSAGRVFFAADDGQHGSELWVTDGSAAHTALVADLAPGSTDSQPIPLGDLTGRIAFRTYAGEDTKLWSLSTASITVVDAGVPTISGSRTVGRTLTAKAGTWEQGATLSYQWFRNSVAISGATKSTYKLTGSSAGKKINVRVTGAKGDEVSGVASSTSTSAIALGTLSRRPTPTISGTRKVGKTLKVKVGTVNTGVSKSYRWYRNGNAISGSDAKTSSYKLHSADRGKRIQVKVTLKKTGYKTVTKTSGKTSKIV